MRDALKKRKSICWQRVLVLVSILKPKTEAKRIARKTLNGSSENFLLSTCFNFFSKISFRPPCSSMISPVNGSRPRALQVKSRRDEAILKDNLGSNLVLKSECFSPVFESLRGRQYQCLHQLYIHQNFYQLN